MSSKRTKKPVPLIKRIRQLTGELPRPIKTPEPLRGALPDEAPREDKQFSKYTTAETEQHIALCEQLMLGTHSTVSIVAAMRERFGLRKGRVRWLMERARQKWQEEDQAARPSNRAAQIRRIERYLQQARGERKPQTSAERAAGIPAGWVTRPDWPAVFRFESLLADVMGTKAPTQVAVTVDQRVTSNLQIVIASLTPEQVAERLLAARERRQKAEQLDRLIGQGQSSTGNLQ